MIHAIRTIAMLVALVAAAFALSTGPALAEQAPPADTVALDTAAAETAPPDIALPETPDAEAPDPQPPDPEAPDPAPDDEVAPEPCAEPDDCPTADPDPTPAPGPDDLTADTCPALGCGADPTAKPGKAGSQGSTSGAKAVVAAEVPAVPRLDVPVPTRIDAGGMPAATRFLLLVAAGILVITSAVAAWMSRPGPGSGARR